MAELAELYGASFGEGSFAASLATDAVTPHVASPDVHVDEAEQRVVMYFHGLEALGIQVSRAAASPNGIDFSARPEVLRPVHPWEGADAPVAPSVPSVAPGRVNQLRDPAVFEDGERRYLLYAVAGEAGIAPAELTERAR